MAIPPSARARVRRRLSIAVIVLSGLTALAGGSGSDVARAQAQFAFPPRRRCRHDRNSPATAS